ncbi:helix-turn-helix domain-containing protein [Planctomicrobium sp. SH664]|uniref:PAS domain-containing protein n=1 Tax=Planctomicrobium sp. SH664 TaxID=3448125 RepID=UPI003F5C62B0
MCSHRQEFFSSLNSQDIVGLFNNLTGVYFFLKDAQGRHMAVNAALVKRLGYRHDSDLFGATDFDLFPRILAEHFVQDDQRVLRTGESLTNTVEAWRNGEPVVTSKFPIRDNAGRVAGIAGVFQVYQGRSRSLLPDLEIQQVVRHIRSHLHERVSIALLAERMLLSVRQLRRRFHKAIGMSIQDFLVKERLEAVRDALLNTDVPIVEIAGRFGFCDQSALTRQFREHIGMTPLKFRQQAREQQHGIHRAR